MDAHRFRTASVALSALLLVTVRAEAADIALPPVPDVAPLDAAVLAPSRQGPVVDTGLDRRDGPTDALQDAAATAPATAAVETTGSIPSSGAAPVAVPESAPPTAAAGRDPDPPTPPAVTGLQRDPEIPSLPLPELKPPVAAAMAPAPTAPAPAPAATLGGEALAAALVDFAAPEAGRRPGETVTQARQRQKDRESIAAFYAARGNAPLWIEGNHLSGPARAALGRIDRAGEDGLNLAAYAVAGLRDPDAPKLAAAELAVSTAVVAYGKQASGSRIDPLQIDPLITAKRTIPEVADILTAVATAPDPDAALRGFNPPQPGYAALRDKLAEFRQQSAPMAHETIPSGPTLRLGMRDARVPLIRSRFGLDLPSAVADDEGLVYDTRVAAAVAEFQRTNGLPVSGVLNPKTIAALSGGNPSRLENELIANMERWRWMPRDLGPDHITVNVPDYSLEVVRDGAVVHRARVVVGKPDHQTPIFSDTMKFIIVNPYWNVPLSIIKKEMMPKLAENPNYFSDHGYEVVERDGQTFVRQPPGEDNALGRIKFMFPNQHSVYLHDTNARALFGKDKRAFSHGCVRVDQPFKLAEVVLGKANGWPESRIRKLIGGDERTIMLPKPLPIAITYFTSFVDDTGGLQLRDDLYGYSARVKAALALRD